MGEGSHDLSDIQKVRPSVNRVVWGIHVMDDRVRHNALHAPLCSEEVILSKCDAGLLTDTSYAISNAAMRFQRAC